MIKKFVCFFLGHEWNYGPPKRQPRPDWVCFRCARCGEKTEEYGGPSRFMWQGDSYVEISGEEYEYWMTHPLPFGWSIPPQSAPIPPQERDRT